MEIEYSSGNIYADLQQPDADEMLIKARLAVQIGKIIRARQWTQAQAADVLHMTQPKLSDMLRGKFRGISEAKMLEYLTRLGQRVQIVVTLHEQPITPNPTGVELVFA